MGREVPFTVILTFEVRYRPIVRVNRNNALPSYRGAKFL